MGAPRIIIVSQTDQEVTLTTDPANAGVMWSIVGGPGETGPSLNFTVPVAPGANVTVNARVAGQSVPSEVSFYFYFDEPPSVAPASEESLAGQLCGRVGQSLDHARAQQAAC